MIWEAQSSADTLPPIRNSHPHILLQEQVMVDTGPRMSRVDQLEIKVSQQLPQCQLGSYKLAAKTYLHKDLVQFEKRNRLPSARPSAVSEHKLNRMSHLGTLLFGDFEPSFRAKNIGVLAKYGLLPHERPVAGRDACPARYESAVDGVALWGDLFEGKACEWRPDPDSLVDDSLKQLSLLSHM